MAIGDFRLSTSRYVRPGAYIGYVRIPRPINDPGNPRYPCYVGRGSRLARIQNAAHKRAYVETEELSFIKVVPYLANLDYAALNDQTLTYLYTTNRALVTNDKWAFRESSPGSGVWDQIEIVATEFDKNATYYIDYQSVDRTKLDDLKFDDLRQMLRVGDTESENKYEEYVDYRIVTEILGNVAGTDPQALIPGSSNVNTDGWLPATTTSLADVGNVGNDIVSIGAAADYIFDYSMHYTVTCTAAVPATSATFDIVVTPLSGGNDQAERVPMHSTFDGLATMNVEVVFTHGAVPVVNYALDTNYPFNDGVKLDFNFASDPTAGDSWSWNAYGPSRVELSSAHDNTNQFSEVDDTVWQGTMVPYTLPQVHPDASSGTIEVSDFTDYSGGFDRKYRFRVYSVGGPTGDGPNGNRQFDILWSGYGEIPYTEGIINVDETDPTTYTKVHLEDDIYVDIGFGAGHADNAILDNLTLPDGEMIGAPDATNLTTALFLANGGLGSCKSRWDEHDKDWFNGIARVPAMHVGGTGTHQTTIVPVDEPTLITFCAELQGLYTSHIGDALMHTPVDTYWMLDSSITPADLASCIEFLNDFKEKYNRHLRSYNYVQGDEWTMNVLAARKEYTDKDDRDYTITIGSLVQWPLTPSMTVAWRSDTYEGGFGNFTLSNLVYQQDLPDNISLMFRNWTTEANDAQRYVANDSFTFSTVDRDQIDWNLEQKVNQTILEDEIFRDILGRVTGLPLSYYVILNDTPSEITRVVNKATGVSIAYSLILDTSGDPTPYLMFTTDPGDDIIVYYRHKGAEPSPSSWYYITANTLRQDALYETPIRYLNRDDMEVGLAPKTTDNSLWIAGDIAFDTAFFGAYFCQVKDAAGNQVFSSADYRRAIDETETVSEITDLVILSFFNANAYAKLSIEKMADPFERKERMLWIGVPIGTPIGDVDTPDSLIYLATKTFQFSGDNPGRGHLVLHGNQQVTRSLVLDDGTATSVELDGSYFAAYSAARNAEFRDPADTLLRKDTASFEDMAVFNEKEAMLLGGASIIWADSVGTSLFRYAESTTLDKSSPDLNEISAMNQKIYVTRKVSRDMDAALISIVPPSPAAGVALVQAFLTDELQEIASSGTIAPYGSEENPPTIRQVSPGTDLYVFVDELDRRLYHFGYFYNIRYPIKRLFGLYSVDTRFWDARS